MAYDFDSVAEEEGSKEALDIMEGTEDTRGRQVMAEAGRGERAG